MPGGPAAFVARAPSPIRFANGFSLWLRVLFYKIGFIVASYPLLFILTSILISTTGFGIRNLRFAQRLQEGFTASDSLSRYEHSVKTEFDGQEEPSVQRFVGLIRRKDEGTLLTKRHIEQVFKIHEFISEKLRVTDGNTSFTHNEICGEYCDANPLLELFKTSCELLLKGGNVLLDHPQSYFQNYGFLVAHHIFGVTRKADIVDEIFIPTESPHSRLAEEMELVGSNKSNLAGIKMFTFYYQAPLATTSQINAISLWEAAVYHWARSQTDFPEYKINVMGDKILGQEMIRGGLDLVPHLVAGLLFTVLFVSISVAVTAVFTGSCDFGRVLIVFGTVISPMLAVSSTFGLLATFNVEIYPIHMVIPFLILAIGVDDAFLMQHAWNRLLPDLEHNKRQNEAIPTILAKVLEEIGPSITLTSLTNSLAFGVGTFVAVPAIQLFCLAAAVAMVMDFVFEIILFGSLLAVSGRFHKPSTGKMTAPHKGFANFLSNYSKWLTKNSTRVFVMLFTALFFVISLYGTITMQTKINSQKIIPHDSDLLEADLMLKRFFWKEYEPVQIFVNSPPDISQKGALEHLRAMVKDFESLPRSIGAQSTIFWLDDYIKTMDNPWFRILNVVDTGYNYKGLPYYFGFTKAGMMWNQTVKWHYDERDRRFVVDKFYLMTGLHNASDWMERAENMLHWRGVAEKWKQFNVTVYNENSPVFEGIFGLRWTTCQTAACTLLSMFVVCFLFVPSPTAVIVASVAILNISLGVFGFLSLWGMDLDPVTMSAIVMSIGFSVDYTAHVSYHFHRAHNILPSKCSSSDLVHFTISAVGWPMLEAALSTLVCFLPVVFHPDYTPKVFVRTIFLVVLFGMLHGVLILPAILSMFPRKFFQNEPAPPTTPVRQLQTLPILMEGKGTECSLIHSSSSFNSSGAPLINTPSP